jgi:HSP20 family protein
MADLLTKIAVATPAVRSTRDPFSLLRAEMNDLVARMWNGSGDSAVGPMLAPALDVSESDNTFEVRMDVPGMAAKDIDIQVRGNVVSVSGKRQEEQEEKGKTYHRIERSLGSFSRSLTLPCDINEDEVAANYENGVLVVTLPKSETNKGRKITVK